MISDKEEDPEEQYEKKGGQEDWGVKRNGKKEVIANKSSLSRRFFYSGVPEQTDRTADSESELMKDLAHSFTGSKSLSATEEGGQLLSEMPWSDFGRIIWMQVGSGICL